MLKKFEGYFRPVLVQIQWCLSLLTLLNTMFLVLGTPGWVKQLYLIYGIFMIFWLIYYFKRGRRQELSNIVEDNPIYDEVKKIREMLEHDSSSNSKSRARSISTNSN